MYKILIVEDEDITRDSLAQTIRSSKLNISTILLAKSGYEGIIIAKSQSPDIIITDIKMPGMNGITMMREILRFMPDIKSLILSAYNDFSYARDAIDLKVSSYLLKPYDEQELLAKIYQMIEELDTRVEKQSHHFLQTEVNHIMRDNFLRELICRNDDIGTFLELLEIYGLSFKQQAYICCCLKAQGLTHEAATEFYGVSQRFFTRRLGCAEFYPLEIGDREPRHLFILGFTEPPANDSMYGEAVSDLCRFIENQTGIRLICGMGAPAVSIRHIRESVQHAAIALHYCFYSESSSAASYSEELLDCSDDTSDRIQFNFELISVKTKILEELRFVHLEKALDLLNRLFRMINEHREYGADSTISLYAGLIMDMRTILLKQFPQETSPGEFDLNSRINEAIHLKELHEMACGIVDHFLKIANTPLEMDKKTRLASEMTRIINEEYTSGLSLSGIAERLNISPGYAGSIFYEIMGHTFNNHLTLVRMDNAKVLLKGSSLRISEIANAVGINDTAYFCTLFKRTVGETPKHFRAQQR